MEQKTVRRLLVAVVVWLLFAVSAAAGDEKLEITAPPSVVKSRGLPAQITRPREADFRPDDVHVSHDPAFVVPFSTTVRTGRESAVRLGLSGWTAPPGRGDLLVGRENPGWLALGLSVVWNVR